MKILLGIVGAMALFGATARSADFSDWSHLMLVKFTGYSGCETLTNFPALVRFDAAESAQMMADAADLRFSDADGNLLAHEVDSFDAQGGTLAWVRVPELDGSTQILAHWGNSAAGAPDYTEDTWADGFLLVQHYSEADSAPLVDSTAAKTTSVLRNASGARVAGKVGASIDLSGGASVGIELPDPYVTLGSEWTISAWFKDLRPYSEGWRTLARGPESHHHVIIEDNSGQRLGSYLGSVLQFQAATAEEGKSAALLQDPAGAWRQITAVGAGGRTLFYLDGELVASGNFQATERIHSLGFHFDGNGSQKFADFLDEARVASRGRSADWVKAEYDNVASPSFSTRVLLDGASSLAVIGAQNIGWESAEIAAIAVEAPLAAYLCWGAAEGGAATGAWENVSGPFAAASMGDLLVAPLSGLQPGALCHARFAVEDGAGDFVWMDCVEFQTWSPLKLEFVRDADEENFTAGVVNVLRDDTPESVLAPLTVNYAFAGAGPSPAVAGVNYVAPSGSVVIPAGTNAAAIHITPLVDAGSSAATTLEVSLASGAYVFDATPAPVAIAKWMPGAAHNTWIAAAGSDGLASNPANWSGGLPTSSDNIMLGVFSGKNMVWDADGANGLPDTVASWTQDAFYTGAVTFNTQYTNVPGAAFTKFTVAGDAAILGGSWTHPANAGAEAYRLRVSVGGDFTLGAGTRIDLQYKGYAAGSFHPGSALGIHGGSRDNFGHVYGDVYEPVNLGSGGRNHAGGGALYLDAGGAATLDGDINANSFFYNANEWNNDNWGGAGGSIYVRAAAINGGGKISANGTNANGPGSSGGRIALIATQAAALGIPLANVYARGDSGNEYQTAGGGTVFTKTAAQTHGALLVDSLVSYYTQYPQFLPGTTGTTCIPPGQTWTFDAVVTRNFGMLSVPEGATLALPNGFGSVSGGSSGDAARRNGILHLGGDYVLGGAAPYTFQSNWVFHAAAPLAINDNVVVKNNGALGCLPLRNTLANFSAFNLTINGDLTVDATSAITAIRAGVDWDEASANATRIVSHGGQGVWIGNHAWGAFIGDYIDYSCAYDSILAPALPGLFGWYYQYLDVGLRSGRSPGGGVINLRVNGAFELNGIVSASAHVVTYDVSAGAAGTINITAGTLAGSGSMEASGYSDHNANKYGGGAGRIAVRLTAPGATFDAFGETRIKAQGYNSGVPQVMTSAGTVYLETPADGPDGGKIVIWNGNNAANIAFTPFPSSAPGGEAEDFRNARLDIGQAARVKLFAPMRINEALTRAGTELDLNGQKLTLDKLALSGQRVTRSGAFTAAQLLAFGYTGVTDTDPNEDGLIEIIAASTIFIIR